MKKICKTTKKPSRKPMTLVIGMRLIRYLSKFHNLKTLILLISTITKKDFTPLISNMLSDTKTKNDGGEIT